MNAIADVQSSFDKRNLPINQVGVKDLKLPIIIASQDGTQSTVALFTMTVFLPAEQKGTHMSRFVELIEDNEAPIDFANLENLTHAMLKRLHSSAGKLSLHFPFFRKKSAPISKSKSYLDYEVTLTGEIKHGQYHHELTVLAPVTSLCPCSKEISQYGAHNQRSHVSVTLQSTKPVEIEEVIDLIELQASCQLYGLLKRPDEKYVTEKAYDNPKFVEDMVRDITASLKADSRINQFKVESENFESIHNHSAYAVIEYPEN